LYYIACREKRVKCDELHPICSRCIRLELTCQWDKPALPASNLGRTHGSENTSAPPDMTPINAKGRLDLATGVDNGSGGAGSSGYSAGVTSGDGCSSGSGGCGGGGEGAASSASTTSGIFSQQLKLGDGNRHDFNTAGIAEGSIQVSPFPFELSGDTITSELVRITRIPSQIWIQYRT